jgi:hypothetical protein
VSRGTLVQEEEEATTFMSPEPAVKRTTWCDARFVGTSISVDPEEALATT